MSAARAHFNTDPVTPPVQPEGGVTRSGNSGSTGGAGGAGGDDAGAASDLRLPDFESAKQEAEIPFSR